MNSPAFSGAPEPGVGSSPDALDDRLRQPVAVAEVVVRVVERRGGLEVERREHLHPLAPRDEFSCSACAALALRDVAGEEDGDGVEVRAGQASHPVVGMIRARVAEDLRAGDHALLELLRETWPATPRPPPAPADRSR